MARNWRKKNVKSLAEAGIDPLKLVVQRNPDAESAQDSKGLTHIRRRFLPSGRIYRWLARRLRYKHEIQLKLDEAGSAFWELVDGRRNLGDIAREMAGKFQSDVQESRKAAVQFARVLTQKRLIHLILPAESGGENPKQEEET
jgi:hypothetical protein